MTVPRKTTMHTHSIRRAARRAGTPPRRTQGYTMTELVVTVAIAAILTTVAVPSFNGLIAAKRAQTFASDLYVTLAKTRSTALTLNNNVTLQPNGGGWSSGWQIVDSNGNVLDNHAAATGVTVAAGAPVSVIYGASGRLPVGVAAPVFVISAGNGSTQSFQCVSLTLSGRPYMKASNAC